MPMFSVVIPTYNRQEHLQRALDSVFAQQFDDYEVIVVDDGSTDDTRCMLAELGEKVRTIHQENSGPSVARNAGVRLASGKYVVFLDSDDRWYPWTLQVFARVAADYGYPGWLYGGYVSANDRTSVNLEEGRKIAATHFADYATAAQEDGLMPLPSGVAMSRELFLEMAGFCNDLPVAEDIDLWFRVGPVTDFVRVDAPPLYERDANSGNLSVDIGRSYAGILEIVKRERHHVYVGSGAWQFTRRAIITRQLLQYAHIYRMKRDVRRAARFYLEVFRFQLQSGFREPSFGGRRNRFLLNFPIILACPELYRRLRSVVADPQGAADSGHIDRG